jgi:hypothetical protein
MLDATEPGGVSFGATMPLTSRFHGKSSYERGNSGEWFPSATNKKLNMVDVQQGPVLTL